ncbi:hypothetical protein KM043_000089 [Ampulex compressa]|nr:hypothetical protein KM043_000089 [Ampulex compressa]
MTRRCDSNPAQYERNRRFGHLVHALGRAAGGAKLPSVGLCLNASKAVSFLVKGGNDIFRSLVSRKAQNNVTLLEQLPRCDLLRLSPWLGDSSCRLDETPAIGRERSSSLIRAIHAGHARARLQLAISVYTSSSQRMDIGRAKRAGLSCERAFGA